MKRILGFILILMASACNAQLRENQQLYLNCGLTIGNYIGAQAGLNFAVKEKYSLQLEYSSIRGKAKSTPDDYIIGLIDLFAFGTTLPFERINALRFMGGKLISIKQSNNSRFNLKAGVEFITGKEPYNWRKVDSYFFTSNYEFDYKTSHGFGIIIKPEFEYIFAGFAGINVSPFIDINRFSVVAGINAGFLLGKLQ